MKTALEIPATGSSLGSVKSSRFVGLEISLNRQTKRPFHKRHPQTSRLTLQSVFITFSNGYCHRDRLAPVVDLNLRDTRRTRQSGGASVRALGWRLLVKKEKTLLARVERLRIGRSNRPQSLGVSLSSYMKTEINPVSETLFSLLLFLYTRRWTNFTSQAVPSITTYHNMSSGNV
jgi:hypothetical protein